MVHQREWPRCDAFVHGTLDGMNHGPTRSTLRLAAALYAIPMFVAPFSMMYVPSKILGADATGAAVMDRLRAHELLFRLGVGADLAIVLAELVLCAVLFELFAPAHGLLARSAVYARLAMTALQATNIGLSLAALHFSRETSQDALGTAALAVHGQCVHLWEACFALHLALLSALVWRSGFAPRTLGALLALAAGGYALNGAGALLVPSCAAVFAAVVAGTAVVGEVPFVLWLAATRRGR
jgi:hypothetical protein